MKKIEKNRIQSSIIFSIMFKILNLNKNKLSIHNKNNKKINYLNKKEPNYKIIFKHNYRQNHK